MKQHVKQARLHGGARVGLAHPIRSLAHPGPTHNSQCCDIQLRSYIFIFRFLTAHTHIRVNTVFSRIREPLSICAELKSFWMSARVFHFHFRFGIFPITEVVKYYHINYDLVLQGLKAKITDLLIWDASAIWHYRVFCKKHLKRPQRAHAYIT